MDELVELTPVDIKPSMTAEMFDKLLKPLRSGAKTVVNFETVHRRKNGTDYNVLVKFQLLHDDSGAVFFAAVEDTAERDAAIRALSQVSQRLDTVLSNTTMSVFSDG